MADGIQRYKINAAGFSEKHDYGDFVFFSDVQARLEAADRLAEAVGAFQEESYRDGLASEMAAALAAYRESEQ